MGLARQLLKEYEPGYSSTASPTTSDPKETAEKYRLPDSPEG